MASATQIWSELDLDAEGKQVGWLHLPHSVHRSAYGTIAIPIAVVRNGAGPTVLITAGNHGDEYEGQVVVCDLIRALEPGDVQGAVILMPAVNLPAALAGSRVSPIDGANLNRCFPGRALGTVTEQIAYYLHHELLPRCVAWFDLHSGGSSLDYVPFASIHRSRDEGLNLRALATLRAFGAPVSFVWGYFPEPHMAVGSAHHHGLIYLGSELGGAGTTRPDVVCMAWDGTLRALRQLEVLTAEGRLEAPPAPATIRLLEIAGRDDYVYAPCAGLFEPLRRLGEEVGEGELLGRIHFVDDPLRAPVPVHFRHGGLFLCVRHPSRVERGDCLAHVGTDLEGEALG
jgi:predicted deacylase